MTRRNSHVALFGALTGPDGADAALPIDRLLRIAATATRAPITLAVLHEPAGGPLTLLGRHDPAAPAADVTLPQGLLTAVIAAGLPIIVNDTAFDRRYRTAALRGATPAAFAGFPIRDRYEHAIGAVALADRQARAWTTRELDIADQTAQLVSAALPRCSGRRRPGPGGGGVPDGAARHPGHRRRRL
ncbi:hypothetical protein GCM10020218_038100 [Dactylosporangium vinaceum]